MCLFCISVLTEHFAAATGEPEGKLWRAEDNDYAPDSANSARTNAALISLVRNEELDDLIPTMRDLERTWNNKFNYPWIFFNDQPFTQEFKKRTQAETKAKCIYGTTILLLDSRLEAIVSNFINRTGSQGAMGYARLYQQGSLP